MKRTHQSKKEKVLKEGGIWAENRLPWDWWLHPTFNMEINLPFSYIWFAYWLIVWEWDDHQIPLWERGIEKFHGISFMPD